MHFRIALRWYALVIAFNHARLPKNIDFDEDRIDFCNGRRSPDEAFVSKTRAPVATGKGQVCRGEPHGPMAPWGSFLKDVANPWIHDERGSSGGTAFPRSTFSAVA